MDKLYYNINDLYINKKYQLSFNFNNQKIILTEDYPYVSYDNEELFFIINLIDNDIDLGIINLLNLDNNLYYIDEYRLSTTALEGYSNNPSQPIILFSYFYVMENI